MSDKKDKETMSFLQQRRFAKEVGAQYGINPNNYTSSGRSGSFGHNGGQLSADREYQSAVTRAMANDYDVRRSIEAAQATGDKRAKELGSINNLQQAYNAHNFMKDVHKKDLNRGGKYTNPSDESGVTSHLVGEQDKFLMSRMKKMAKKNAPEAPKPEEAAPSEPAELSGDMQDAIDRTAGAGVSRQGDENKGIVFGSINGNKMSYDPNAGVSSPEAAGQLNDYTVDLKSKMKNKGVKTRGPGSINSVQAAM